MGKSDWTMFDKGTITSIPIGSTSKSNLWLRHLKDPTFLKITNLVKEKHGKEQENEAPSNEKNNN